MTKQYQILTDKSNYMLLNEEKAGLIITILTNEKVRHVFKIMDTITKKCIYREIFEPEKEKSFEKILEGIFNGKKRKGNSRKPY